MRNTIKQKRRKTKREKKAVKSLETNKQIKPVTHSKSLVKRNNDGDTHIT